VTGYLHPAYAQSFAQFGDVCELPRCGGWILRRQIPGFADHDGMGCYPLFACRDWSLLPADLDSLRGDLVALALVADPFGQYDVAQLRSCFDIVIPYKSHFIVDLDRSVENVASRHHRYEARRALREVQVEPCPDPRQFLEEWVQLYANVIQRYEVRGVRAFSREAFERQLAVPGTVIFRAIYKGVTVAADWYCVQGEVAYAHLAACAPSGYEVGAAYALLWAAIKYFGGRVRWLDLGGSAGLGADGRDGLSFFKRGWSTETRSTYFCGRILDPPRYGQIVHAKGESPTTYFPAYREGEFSQ